MSNNNKNLINQNKSTSFYNENKNESKSLYSLDYVNEKLMKNDNFTFSSYFADLKDLISDKHDLK